MLHRLTLSCLFSSRPLLKCIRCPTESRSRTRRGRQAEVKAASGIPTERGTRRATTRVTKKRSTLLPAGKGDPNLLTTRRAPVTRRPFRLGSRQSLLGRPLRHQLKKLQSSPRLLCRRLRRRCRESKLTFLLLLRECSSFAFTRRSVLFIFPLV